MAAVGIVGNIFLAVFKLLAGILGHSAAMLSDSIHTLSDVFATLIAYIGVTISRKEADGKHPYGHERLECVASMLLSGILFVTGAGIGLGCIKAIIAKTYLEAQVPGMMAVIAAVVSIVVKEAMFWYTM
ncbi:MAG: cation diffusion facilitator family transporter, partial [Lachnospiraceae bacterium]|nr:cation diffusion facilitator family transporter [Lachnospiraceae bacterium]